ncbi:hypothetical protein ACLMJK_007965 [Lecanora helva]
MSINPRNPPLQPGVRIPALGKTRAHAYGLEWFDSDLEAWRPAVRQYTIRDRLLQAVQTQGQYMHPRGAGNGNNVTAPLASDLHDGGDWQNRPERLFQLDPAEDQYKHEPTGVLTYGDRVMLDPFDHPIRDFGDDLPIILSSEMKGWEVENHLRKNLAIRVYDLVARCPRFYKIRGTMHTNPPDINTVRERATKFREKAGCLAWSDREGSKAIRSYILSLLPAGATTTRWLCQDLTPAQVQERKAVNKGRFPQRRRKAVRDVEARAEGKGLEDRVKKGRVTKATGGGDGGKKKRPSNVGYEPERIWGSAIKAEMERVVKREVQNA